MGVSQLPLPMLPLPPDKARRARITSMFGIVVLLVLTIYTYTREPAALERTHIFRGDVMGTRYVVKVVAVLEDSDGLRSEIAQTLGVVDQRMSTYKPASEISRFNAAEAGDYFPVSAEVVQVVSAAQDVSAASGGAFDVTIGPLVDVWGFGPQRRTEPPDADAIAAAQTRVGWEGLAVRTQPPALRKMQSQLRVDLSAIAKGFGVDQVARLLEARGFQRAMVEVGGEVRAHGTNGRGQLWQIGIERPEFGSDAAVFAVVALEDQAVATSGTYRNYYKAGDQRVAHLIDPRTGRPTEHRTVSVSVVADTAMAADAWATALHVLGAEAGLALATQRGLAALFIEQRESGFAARSSPAWQDITVRKVAPTQG